MILIFFADLSFVIGSLIKEYKCSTCNSTFQRKSSLIRHKRYTCEDKKRFACPYCQHRSKLASNVYKHVRHFHPESEVFAIDDDMLCKKQP